MRLNTVIKRHFKVLNHEKNFKMKNIKTLSLDNIIQSAQVFSIFAMAAFFVVSQTFG